MPRPVPEPDALSRPFWDAVNERRLVVQQCASCKTLQFPPREACQDCGSTELGWHQTGGRGHIQSFVVLMDSHIPAFHEEQPLNLAVVALDEDPRINFYSNLPGTAPRQVPVGAPVEVMFEEVAPGQLIHEWRVAG